MKTILMAFACLALLSGCDATNTPRGPSGVSPNVGGDPNVGDGVPGSTSSTSILMQRIKAQNGNSYPKW